MQNYLKRLLLAPGICYRFIKQNSFIFVLIAAIGCVVVFWSTVAVSLKSAPEWVQWAMVLVLLHASLTGGRK